MSLEIQIYVIFLHFRTFRGRCHWSIKIFSIYVMRELDSLPLSSASLFRLQIGNESLGSHGHRQERSAEIAFPLSNCSCSSTDQPPPELWRREIKLPDLKNPNAALSCKNSHLALGMEGDFLA